MAEKRISKFHEEFKLLGFLKLWETNQSAVDYIYNVKDEEIADRIILEERLGHAKNRKELIYEKIRNYGIWKWCRQCFGKIGKDETLRQNCD